MVFVLPELIAHEQETIGQRVLLLHGHGIAAEPVLIGDRAEMQHERAGLRIGPKGAVVARGSLAAKDNRARLGGEMGDAFVAQSKVGVAEELREMAVLKIGNPSGPASGAERGAMGKWRPIVDVFS